MRDKEITRHGKRALWHINLYVYMFVYLLSVPSEYIHLEFQDFVLILGFENLGQYLVCNMNLINICWIKETLNEWMNELRLKMTEQEEKKLQESKAIM